jgi:plastin-1
LNTLFCAEIFNTCPGLQATEEEYNAAQMLDDDAEGTREERCHCSYLGFRMWANSLGIEDLYINNLYEDFKDGIALLKI